ncbi:MAG: M48 family metalloprotease [Oscillatoria sp. PMC 1068.18]|nr:M48 family metalloprotease [Oscillatoria sp. PMC 1076.18]MEC4989873.1 M48 family metalloprotease [Oscillatoria sp. PMC 1068.18]
MPSYPGISSEAFRHPLDRQAELTLRSVPGFNILARSFVEYLYERPQNIYLLGNNIQVGPRQYSTVYGIFRECVRDLDIHPEPTLFVTQNPVVNAYSLGHERPYIVLNTGLLDLLDEIEIRTVLAHELGHIKCDHSILIQMAIWAMGAASLLGELTLGLGNLINSGLIYAFYEWRRKAELSADRAAMLVIDDQRPIMQMMMKSAGGSHKYAHECSLKEFIQQADDYQELDQKDSLNQIYKFLIYNGGNGAFLTHPFPVERLHYLREWVNSTEYQQIRQGNYQRSEASGAVNVDSQASQTEVEELRRQVEELQREIEREKQRRQK